MTDDIEALKAEIATLRQERDSLRQTLHGRIQGSGNRAWVGLLKRAEAAEAENARLRAALQARRKHQGQLQEAAHKLYVRFGKADEDVMDVWSLAVINPEPPTEADIQRARELFKRSVASETDNP